jgi:hypothetical protein
MEKEPVEVKKMVAMSILFIAGFYALLSVIGPSPKKSRKD